MRVASAVLSAALAGLAAAHISVISPCPRYSPIGENCPAIPPGEVADTGDKAINGPISSVELGGTMPLCRHTTPFATPAAVWTAGQAVQIKFNPSAAIHSGGNCQFSISYDNGATFAVIHEELQYCFLGAKPSGLTNTPSILQYTFNLPSDLPSSDKAVFAWTWVNASGNREFYMNCVDVAIKGGASKSYTGRKMVVANYPGYPTIPEFNGDYNTGMEHYVGAPNVTVSPGGNSSPLAPPAGASGTDYNTSPATATPPAATTSLAGYSSASAPPRGILGYLSSYWGTKSHSAPTGDHNMTPTAGAGVPTGVHSMYTDAAAPADDYRAMPEAAYAGAVTATDGVLTDMPSPLSSDYAAPGAQAFTSRAPAAADYAAPTAAAGAYSDAGAAPVSS
ncbi:hypothetical protein H4R21_003486 [Coemansia helicoidea]|uniref:Uncharacterized protein n=1 Tax=Coemansia helicoidea TaxID=1286919 RepID=A0ACC1L214_9FUNG|nr:hypothetical protein H4R21_003486 [Coemansia helicoidea]